MAAGGRHLIWFYAPGYIDGERLDKSGVSEMTGMDIVEVASCKSPMTLVEYGVLPSVEYAVEIPKKAYGAPQGSTAQPVRPLFAVSDAKSESLGRYMSGGKTGETSFARKSFDSWTSWYSVLPVTNPKLLREIFRLSGAHIYTESDDVVYAGGGIVAYHTAARGSKTVMLRNGRKVTINPATAATLILDGETGEAVLE